MRPSRAFLICSLLFLAADLVFLRWVFIHWENWGFWDWDYQQTLLETARQSLLHHGQLPLWNPYIGGGAPLAGNSLNHTFSPCFLLILLFGTVKGVKVCIGLYALLGQVGMYRFARQLGIGSFGAFLAGLIYIVGGVYAQRLTHGHFEWIAIAWFPFVLWMLEKSRARLSRRSVALGGLFMAFIFLDGGPYQFAFFAIFASVYTLLRAARVRSTAPLTALFMVLALGVGLAAVKLVPVFENVSEHPREVVEDNFYGAPFTPEPLGMMHRAFVARDQFHRADAWMPYNLNVGCYVGWIPILLALLALGVRFRQWWHLIACALLFFWTMLGSVLPLSPWDLFGTLPGLSMLRVPSRFNVFVILLLALFAGEGLEWFRDRFRARTIATWLAGLLIVLVGVDLLWVNGRVFQVAFSVPPLKVEPSSEFRFYKQSPFFRAYEEAVLHETFLHWPSAAFPVLLENRGVISSYRSIPFPSYTIPFGVPAYRGEAWFASGPGRVEACHVTPNRIEVETDGGGGLLVINMNHHQGWMEEGTDPGAIKKREGLIALKLPPGREDTVLVFWPFSFLFGAGCSVVFLGVLLVIVLPPRRIKVGPGSSPDRATTPS